MSKGKILVVDDDRLVLTTLAHGLMRAGFEVIDADNGDDAILLAREHHPVLALLDIRMEGLSGFDVAIYLREPLQIPFIFLSAFTDEATLAKVKALGAMAYLVKPLDVHQIVPTVEAAVAQLAARPQASAEPELAYVPLAVGALMHRYSLGRAEALRSLQALAADEDQALDAVARRVVDAIELLAAVRPATGPATGPA